MADLVPLRELSGSRELVDIAVAAYERALRAGTPLPSPAEFGKLVETLAARADLRPRWPRVTPEIRDLVERFLAREGELGRHARRAYRRAITRALEELQGELLTSGRLGEYVTARLAVGAARATMKLEVAAIRGWFRWLVDEGVIRVNPVGSAHVKLAGGDVKPAPALSLPEMQAVLDAPLRSGDQVLRALREASPSRGKRAWKEIPRLQRLRDRALLHVGFFLGLRRSELAGLTVGALRVGGPRGLTLTYRAAKGARLVLVRPLRFEVQDALRDYLVLRARGKVGPTPPWDQLLALPLNEPLFRARALEPRAISPAKLDAIVRRWAGVAGVPRHPPEGSRPVVSAHSMRGTYITLAHRAGADIRKIQASVGHASYDTTARYIQDSSELEMDPTLQIGG